MESEALARLPTARLQKKGRTQNWEGWVFGRWELEALFTTWFINIHRLSGYRGIACIWSLTVGRIAGQTFSRLAYNLFQLIIIETNRSNYSL